MSLIVGEVISVKGSEIIAKMFNDSNKTLYRYDGEIYHGVALREYVSIQSGIYNILCMVEGEYLDESSFENSTNSKYYIRKILLKPVGYKDGNDFCEGKKYLPMIKDNVYLLTESELSVLYTSNQKMPLKIGNTLKDEISYSVDAATLFNSHIGIFGNTGSGKSNTLTKLYKELFDKYLKNISGSSNFVVFDFNGEFTGEQFINNDKFKKTIELNTRHSKDKIRMSEKVLWNVDIIGLLFKATYNTQRPFINRVVEGRKRYIASNTLNDYYNATLNNFLNCQSPKKDILSLLKSIVKIINITNEVDDILDVLDDIHWHNQGQYFYYKHTNNNISKDTIKPTIRNQISDMLLDIDSLSFIEELIIRANLQLVNDLIKGHAQFDHIHPLLNRIMSLKDCFEKVIEVDSKNYKILRPCEPLMLVISFRKCNQDIKKILPLIIAKSYYEQHKPYSEKGEIKKTLHFIIDEAHNILSYDSSREESTWKDYRLDLFEEIIKEGRKFGVFLTIASQRPADISHTIVSQFHNFFIHKLINDKDLALLDNTITTLDKVSKSEIPTLPKGACIITGSSFVLPVTIQIDYIKEEKARPNSDDVDLLKLWNLSKINKEK